MMMMVVMMGLYLCGGGDDGDDDDDCDADPLVVRACAAPPTTDCAPPSPAYNHRQSWPSTAASHAGPHTTMVDWSSLARPPCRSSHWQPLYDALYSTDGSTSGSTTMLQCQYWRQRSHVTTSLPTWHVIKTA